MQVTNQPILDLEINGEVDYLRQKDFFDPTKNDVGITIVGAGGIGSFTTVLASKMGFTDIVLYDDDSFEAHNIPNQFANRNQVGMAKVNAVKETAESFGIGNVFTRNRKVNENTIFATPYVASGLDSMSARKDTWEAVKNSNEEEEIVKRYWDARIGGQGINIFSVDPNNPGEVEAFESVCLYDDSEASTAPCTARAVIDIMGYVASFLNTQFRREIGGESVPGYLNFSAETFALETSSIQRFAEFKSGVMAAA